jgi:hypothetical protein
MGQDYEVRDLRFDGYDNEALAQQIDGLRSGPGAGSLHDAMGALVKIALGLKTTDDTLRQQLAAIGVTWQGQAADGGTSATENARIYAEDAVDPTIDSAQGVGSSGEAFSTTKNSAPDAGTLRGPTELNGVDQFAGFFGHTTDHAKDVKATNAARQQAVDSMNGYQANSSEAISRSQTLPVPPGMSLVAQPVDTSTHSSSVSVASPTGNLNPAGGGPGGGSGTSFTPGGTSVSPVPTTGPNPPVTGGPPITGGGPLPSNPLLPTAANPLTPALRAANPMLMADAATAMGAGSASGAGAGAESERVARNTAARGSIKNGTPLGAAPEEEARAARNAERFGARSGRPGSSIMQPAAGRNAEGEEDGEHVRRYGVESSDVFDDDRVVAPESIGDDDDDQ